MTRVFVSARSRRYALLSVGLLGVATAAGAVLLGPYLPATDPEAVGETLSAFGRFAPLAFVALQALQVALAPIPGQALGVVGGYLFGPLRGAAYSTAGVLLGSLVVFRATRRYGRPLAERWLEPTVVRRFDDFVQREGTVALFLAFLFPAFPDDALCFLAGLSSLRTRTFLALVLFGRGPTFLLAAYAGEELATADYAAAALIVGFVGVVSLFGYRYRERVRGVLTRN